MSAVKSFNLLYHIYTAYPRSQQSSDANTGIKHHLFYEAFEQLTRRDGCVAFFLAVQTVFIQFAPPLRFSVDESQLFFPFNYLYGFTSV